MARLKYGGYRSLAQQAAIYTVRRPPTTTKEPTMTSTTQQIAAAEAEMARLAEKRDAQSRKIGRATMKRNYLNKEIYELDQQVKALKRRPEPKSDVITFRKSFDSVSGKIYTYAAIRYNRRWFVTGVTGPNDVSWDQLVEFIQRDNTLPFNFDERPGGPNYSFSGITITPSL